MNLEYRAKSSIAWTRRPIEMLPVSASDDRIRISAYWVIYGHATLARYRLSPHPPIRIIVNNGNYVDASRWQRYGPVLCALAGQQGTGSILGTNNLQVGS